ESITGGEFGRRIDPSPCDTVRPFARLPESPGGPMTASEEGIPRGRMRGLVVANALGSFNDNAWKIVVALLALRALRASGVAGPGLEMGAQRQASLAFIIFTVPLVLASLPAGVLADR